MRAGDEEDPLGEDFEEDGTFAAVAAGEDDENFPWLQGGSWFEVSY